LRLEEGRIPRSRQITEAAAATKKEPTGDKHEIIKENILLGIHNTRCCSLQLRAAATITPIETIYRTPRPAGHQSNLRVSWQVLLQKKKRLPSCVMAAVVHGPLKIMAFSSNGIWEASPRVQKTVVRFDNRRGFLVGDTSETSYEVLHSKP
jgi:hypothetical protein